MCRCRPNWAESTNIGQLGPKSATLPPNSTDLGPTANFDQRRLGTSPGYARIRAKTQPRPGIDQNIGPGLTIVGPKSARLGPTSTRSRPNSTQIGPGIRQTRPETVKICPNMARNRPDLARIRPNPDRTRAKRPNVARRQPKLARTWPNLARRRSNLARIWRPGGGASLASRDASQELAPGERVVVPGSVVYIHGPLPQLPRWDAPAAAAALGGRPARNSSAHRS